MDLLPDKKRAIFESTLELIGENGFHGTPMSMVAKKACVAAGTIYHYFESKEQLITELFNYIHVQITAVVRQHSKACQPYRDCFFNIWYGLYEYYSEKPNVLMFFEQFVNSPYNTEEAKFEGNAFRQQLMAFFERGIAEGHLKQISPKILGPLAHSNVISTVKIQAAGILTLKDGELDQVPQILWDGIKRT